MAVAVARAAGNIWPSVTQQTVAHSAILGQCHDPTRVPVAAVVQGPWRVVGDCRIDDRAALAAKLAVTGAEVSDLGLLARALDRYGTDVLRHVAGELSFCAWHETDGRAVIGTDAFGTRPIFHASAGGVFVAANASAVVRAALAPPELDEQSVLDFLIFDEVMEPTRTVYRGVERLAAGHLLVVDDRPRPVRAWQLELPEIDRRASLGEHAERLRDALIAATRDRLDQRTALLLSGGLDSSSIAAAAKLLGARPWCVNVELPDEDDEDGRMARLAADALGFPFERCLRTHEEHLLAVTPSNTPQPSYRPFATEPDPLAAAAARAPVVLYGEGGDELWRVDSVPALLRQGSPLDVARGVLRTVLAGSIPYLGTGLRGWPRVRRRRPFVAQAPPWIAPGLRPLALERAAYGTAAYHQRPAGGERAFSAGQLTGPMWSCFFEESSEGGLGRTLDVRFPFLDRRVVAVALSMPALPCCVDKLAVRHAFRDVLPVAVRTRRKFGSCGPALARVAVERSWQTSDGPAAVVWRKDERFRQFVDPDLAGRALASGDTMQVWSALRAWSLARWLACTERSPHLAQDP
ncbi:MAG: hypothetical protein HYS27_09270 [Deltaproteobacteria bacterium]|nr:hypothetical protein [Deltaproteobacteria bacterium]